MNPADRIRAAMDWARAQGITIGRGSFGVAKHGERFVLRGSSCCPLGAVVLREQSVPPLHGVGLTARLILGVSERWQRGFVAGWDSEPHNCRRKFEIGEAFHGPAYVVGFVTALQLRAYA